jgi:hypothetical protein
MSPELVQAISGLGALGFAIIGVWGFATGRIRVGSIVDREAEILRVERNEYKALHSGALSRLDRLADAVEQLTKAVDRMDERRSSAIAEAVEQLTKRLKP